MFNGTLTKNLFLNLQQMVLVAFAMPTSFKFWPFQSFNKSPENSPSLINWKLVETKLAWGVIFLLGGGFALSDACEKVSLASSPF